MRLVNKRWRVKIITISLITLPACITVETGAKPELKVPAQQKAEARIELGIGYLRQGQLTKARSNFEQAIEHAPNFYRAQLSLAHYYQTVGDMASAQKMFRQALTIHPNNGDVLNNYGTFLCKQGDYAQADWLFNQAVAQEYYYSTSASYENAALCALKSGNKNKAITYFSQALGYEPTRRRSLLNLAKLEITQLKLSDARLRLITFMTSHGTTAETLALMIELEIKAGNENLAEKYQHQLTNLDEQPAKSIEIL
ncbi:putative fimbrial biogenesis and twitching motility protein [Vibrio ichthyoenteri ATCC 700023]|uniref:Putative fimbrial biogenesis and twitching motility protein n=1 Tax=Vibrio ichthyoenteri ATCC 700023 TaxID=870968 RepID=F9S2K9_9VIBR|nr:type IV pilus biogenesis/stability protein PilW [Vibrio ichthyoenteri]EGU39555.1 putative fimbrial biogenesis and twitching motility protein [Vibrio ichthyoenteri ATCC 700023]